MIPVRLELKNFLPYRSPDPLRFDGIHLACLTGANGAGKSSLLDAITWALWGYARAKRDDELIHLGQNEMYVQLDFEQEGVIWRVLRRRAGGKRGQSTLDLFILQEDGTKTLQSEAKITLTEEKIRRILRLDYKTFIHSAFLQQGKADAFTTQTPAQRKQILSDILGLDQWARYEEAVKEKLKAISGQVLYCEERIREIDAELARKPGLEAQLTEAAETHVEAQQALAGAEARLKAVEHAPTELRAAREARAERERRQREYARELEAIEAEIERKTRQIADYEEVIAVRADIEAGYAALQFAREADQALADKLRQLKTLDDQRYEARSQLDSARALLENEIKNLRARIAELEQAAVIDYAADLEAVQEEISALQVRELQRDELQESENNLREQRALLESQRKTLTAEGQQLRDRLEQLQAAHDAVCPLCGQELDAEHRAHIVEQLTQDVEAKREAYRECQEKLNEVSAALKKYHEEVGVFDAELRRLSPLIERAGVLQAHTEAAQQASFRVAEEAEHLRRLEAELASEQFAADIREQLASLDAMQRELGYDESTHDDARQQVHHHSRYEQLYVKLSIALDSVPAMQEALGEVRARKERLLEAAAGVEAEIAALDGDIARLGALVEEYNVREAEVRAQRTRERSAYERLVSAEQALAALETQAERKIQLEARLEKSRYDEALYNELKRAFGKNGIPAMIIETAIPELEATANELLARMTDGRMHLRFTTQKEKVTGGVAETLEIDIADELGTRAYELYSGGEAFRIDFAVRIALSKLLARRAGAHLRTLFIDEGFGTQDDEGRTRLVEAITAIQDDFDLILVITHIDDLRDSFPVHIVVDKTPSGSRVAVR